MRRLALLAATMAVLMAVLSGCAHVPVVNERQLRQEAAGTQTIRVYGVRGPLSTHQTRQVLARVAAQAPNADALARHLAVEQLIAASPLYAGNNVQVLRDGAQTFPAMFAVIEGARHTLDLEYYTMENVKSGGRELGTLLQAKARAGVRVSVIYDAIGSMSTPAAFFQGLRAAGVRLVQYNPINPLKAGGSYAPNDRDHRKILIADDSIAIVGGVNLSSSYESETPLSGRHFGVPSQQQVPPAERPVWHDIDLEIRGPAVGQLSKLFREHWHDQKAPPLEPDPAFAQRAEGKQIVRVIGSSPARVAPRYYATVLTAIRSAQSSIWMTAAYFVPTYQELRALKHAARRGVDVRIILPSHTDAPEILPVQRSYYGELLRAGIKVYERSTGIVHSKTLVIDGVWSLVGSSNFDQRSVLFNDEVDVVVLGNRTADQLRAGMQSDMSHARRIDWQFVHRQGAMEHLRAWFWRLWQRLL